MGKSLPGTVLPTITTSMTAIGQTNLTQAIYGNATGGTYTIREPYNPAADSDRLLKVASELYEIERLLTSGQPLTPSTVEAGSALTRARWALLGVVKDKWAETARDQPKNQG
jgi:hypothetical protein